MTRRNRYEGHWCALMWFHLRRLRLTASAFAGKVGVSQQAAHAYISGKVRPPFEAMPQWADALGLNASEREQLATAAWEAHVPPPVWKKLLALQHELAAKNEAECPPAILEELKRSRAALRAAHEALTRLDAWGRAGRPLPSGIAALIHKAIALTAVAPSPEETS